IQRLPNSLEEWVGTVEGQDDLSKLAVAGVERAVIIVLGGDQVRRRLDPLERLLVGLVIPFQLPSKDTQIILQGSLLLGGEFWKLPALKSLRVGRPSFGLADLGTPFQGGAFRLEFHDSFLERNYLVADLLQDSLGDVLL